MMNSITKKTSVLRFMHCFRCITSNGISCDLKCWKHILANAHSSIDLRTILWMTIWFGMWNFNTFHFKRNNWNATCNDVATNDG